MQGISFAIYAKAGTGSTYFLFPLGFTHTFFHATHSETKLAAVIWRDDFAPCSGPKVLTDFLLRDWSAGCGLLLLIITKELATFFRKLSILDKKQK